MVLIIDPLRGLLGVMGEINVFWFFGIAADVSGQREMMAAEQNRRGRARDAAFTQVQHQTRSVIQTQLPYSTVLYSIL